MTVAPLLLESMRERVARHATSPCRDTIIPRVTLSIVSQPGSGVASVHTPVTCLILQGAKRVTIGDTALDYDNSSYFLASLDVPAMGQIRMASAQQPYVAVGLELDRAAIADLVAQMPAPMIGPDRREQRVSFGVAPTTPDLLQAWSSLLELLDRPGDVAMLAPMREREILYRLLQGPLGGHLRQMAREDSRMARIRRAIGWIRDHHRDTLSIATLAGIASMSVSSFHRHFRAATAISPLQYQKTVRLHAARRLLAGGMPASAAAYAVGYESASQFSREYRRSFGVPPSLDMAASPAGHRGAG